MRLLCQAMFQLIRFPSARWSGREMTARSCRGLLEGRTGESANKSGGCAWRRESELNQFGWGARSHLCVLNPFFVTQVDTLRRNTRSTRTQL